MSRKIPADVGDKVKFFPRSERYETRADLSRTSQVKRFKMKASKKFSELLGNCAVQPLTNINVTCQEINCKNSDSSSMENWHQICCQHQINLRYLLSASDIYTN